MKKRVLSCLIVLLAIPAVILLGNTVFSGVKYVYLTLLVSAMSLAPFLISFEKKEHTATYLVLIGALTALSVLGRVVFSVVPAFKPVSAMVVITAMYFGPEAGFLTGALSALLSNFYFGQGPWTVFQMAAWGLIGFFSGLLAQKLKGSRLLLCVWGAAAGVAYSLLMDIWDAIFADGTVMLSRYLAFVASSAGFTAMYAVSNVVFLLLLANPIGKILERIRTKYGI